MIQNTVSALQIIIDDLKKYIKIFKFIFVLFSIGMVVFQICINSGNKIVNFILLGLLVTYYVVDTFFISKKKSNPRKVVRATYSWINIILNAVALSSTIYTLYSATSMEKISPMSIVLATLSIILFIIKVILEIVTEVLSSKFSLLKAGIAKDIDESFIARHFMKNKLPEDFIKDSTSNEKHLFRIREKIKEKKENKNK